MPACGYCKVEVECPGDLWEPANHKLMIKRLVVLVGIELRRPGECTGAVLGHSECCSPVLFPSYSPAHHPPGSGIDEPEANPRTSEERGGCRDGLLG